MTSTVSAKIPDELKQDLENEDVNVSEVIRTALEEEIQRRRRERLLNDAAALRDTVRDDIETDEIVSTVRETREER